VAARNKEKYGLRLGLQTRTHSCFISCFFPFFYELSTWQPAHPPRDNKGSHQYEAKTASDAEKPPCAKSEDLTPLLEYRVLLLSLGGCAGCHVAQAHRRKEKKMHKSAHSLCKLSHMTKPSLCATKSGMCDSFQDPG
jgi:hypothetical protein